MANQSNAIGDVGNYVGRFKCEDDGKIPELKLNEVDFLKDEDFNRILSSPVGYYSGIWELTRFKLLEDSLKRVLNRYFEELRDVMNNANGVFPRLAYAGRVLILEAPELIAELPELNVLDLGCGNCLGIDAHAGNEKSRIYEPWYCRLLHAAGAKVTGIDKFPVYPEGQENGEGWRFIKSDLLDHPEVIGEFKEAEFDLVNMGMFLPGLMTDRSLSEFSRATSPMLLRVAIQKELSSSVAGGNILRDFREKILMHLLKVMKHGAVLFIGPLKYIKVVDKNGLASFFFAGGSQHNADDLSHIKI